MRKADDASIPGGKALVVDRELFAKMVTREIEAHPRINVVRKEIEDIPDRAVIVATGPLTSNSFAEQLGELTGTTNLFLF